MEPMVDAPLISTYPLTGRLMPSCFPTDDHPPHTDRVMQMYRVTVCYTVGTGVALCTLGFFAPLQRQRGFKRGLLGRPRTCRAAPTFASVSTVILYWRVLTRPKTGGAASGQGH